MKFKIAKELILAASVLAMSVSLSIPARAEQAAPASEKAKDAVLSAAAPKDGADRALMHLSQEGFSAVRAVRAARIALFNGKPELVKQLLDSADASLQAAEKEAPSFTVKVSETVDGKNEGSATENGKVDLIPIDATLALADDYVPTHEKKNHIAKANEHFKKGQTKEAMEELRLADIDLNYTRILMPIDATKKHVDQAIKLLDEHKYYEANLALKAVEDGLTVQTMSLIEPMGKRAPAPQKPGK
jgi:hypothetical protein